MTIKDVIDILQADGPYSNDQLLDALEDGECLAALGFTDADQDVITETFHYLLFEKVWQRNMNWL